MQFKNIPNLKQARILISNDDGIDAPGIKVLEEAVRKICDNVWVVAPLFQKSGAGHSVSSNLFRLHNYNSFDDLPVTVKKIDDYHYAVDGTPGDCVNTALSLFFKDQLPDLVLTGVNWGRNYAEDITYSGTIGAAIEALIHGVPAVAFSQHMDSNGEINWDITHRQVAPVLQHLSMLNLPINTLINVNFPACTSAEFMGAEIARIGERRFCETSRQYKLKGTPNYLGNHIPRSDIKDDYQVIDDHKIAITPIKIDMTDYDSIEILRKAFNDFKL